jgi:hypothetical protein
MKSLMFPTLAAAVAVLLLAHYSCPIPGGGGRGAHRSMSPLAALQLLAAERDRADRLEERGDALLRCQRGKEKAARELIAGRRTLLETAGVFRDLQQAVPSYAWAPFRRAYPGDSDDERFCRCVIRLVATILAEGAVSDAAVVKRLEDELESHRRRGTLRLPGRCPKG